jgi:uncharacterized membrane protein YeaQ/YmgE (transglycosylase-associated protein family)
MVLDNLLVLVLVGLVAGFLASHFVSGHGYGLIGDIVTGILGAVLGNWLAGRLGIEVTGLVGSIIIAFIGAAILIALLRLFTGSRFGSRYGAGRRRWY